MPLVVKSGKRDISFWGKQFIFLLRQKIVTWKDLSYLLELKISSSQYEENIFFLSVSSKADQ